MAFSTHEFKLDLTPGASRPVLYASQGDIGRPFMARCYWNGATWNADAYTVNIRGRKPDETVFDYTATVDGSTVTFETTEQMTIVSGPVECELVFSQGGDVIASANFVLIVEESPYNPDALSESDVDTLGELVSDQIPPAVESWLDEHPEATTTVQDGSVTYTKLATSVLAYVTPEMFGVEGDDADKLEFAINNIEPGGSLFIDRTYTLTRNIVITKNSATKRIYVIGTNKTSSISFSNYHFTGSIVGNTGNILFRDISFTGNSALFNGDYLIRFVFEGCSFTDCGSIFFTEKTNADAYFQNLRFNNCVIRNLQDYIINLGLLANQNKKTLYDVCFNNCIIEWCLSGILNATDYDGVVFVGNCVEGFETNEPLFCNMRTGMSFVVSKNYFEKNITTYFDFSNFTVQNPFTFIFECNNVQEYTSHTVTLFLLGSRKGMTGSVFSIHDNTFFTDSSNQNVCTIFDASATTEKMTTWSIYNNNNYNGYMALKNDPNENLSINGSINETVSKMVSDYGLIDMKSGTELTFYLFVTCFALNTSTLSIPVAFPFLTPNVSYSYEVKSVYVTNIGSMDKTKAQINGDKYTAGFWLRYVDSDNPPFTTNRPYEVRVGITLTFH